MEFLPLVIIGLGMLLAVIGGLMVLFAAFRQSILWGLAYLLIPFASLIYIIRHWSEAKPGFLLSLLGTVLAGIGFFVSPASTAALLARNMTLGDMSISSGAQDLTARIEEKRDQILKLEARISETGALLAKQYNQLRTQREALKSDDTDAVTAFNAEAALYQAENARAKELKVSLETATGELNTLLAERAKAATPGSGKKIVMYTTSRCPACVVAKRYLTQRGIPFEELDVERKPEAFAEFKRLGGRGVPLILVGDQRMEGFNPAAFEKML